MKVFIRSIKGSDCSSIVNKIDYLSIEDDLKTVIYKIDVSIEENSQFSGSYDDPAQSIINNIFTTQILIVNNQSITIPPGFYSLENLFAIINQQSIAISLIKNEENAYHTKTSTTFDFTNAREIQEILGFDSEIISEGSISTNPANITRGLNVIQLYSSITNSDSDIPIVTIKIDNPLESFHQSYETNINVKNSILNYIDVHFRDIAGNLITLNGNITINFYFKTFDEVIEQIFESNNNRFNITSQITNLDNGHYSHKLSRPINLTNSKIVNANFLTNGSIYNISTDQTVTIDGIPFIVQKGCYTLEEILSVMNNLTGAVFSYINSGENCYKIQIDNISSIKFETPELANMLGFGCNLIESANIVEKYQLTSNNNVFKLIVNSGSWILNVEPGIYTEQQFFKQLESAIRPYDSSIKIIIHEHYVEFDTNTNLLIDEYTKNKLQDYHWFKGFYKRNPETTNFTIARYNSFYFNETVTINRYLQYFISPTYGFYDEKNITANFSDGTSKNYKIDNKIRNNKWTKIDEIAYIIQYLTADHFDMTIENNRSQFVFKSKDGVGVYFTQCNSLCKYLNLPTGSVKNFTMHMKNVHIGNMNFNNETIGFRLNNEQEWHDYTFDNTTTTLPYLMVKFRDFMTPFIENCTGTKGGYFMYANVFNVSFVVNGAVNKLDYIQFRGSLLNKGILKGFPTTKTKPVKMIIESVFQNQHQINLGYTSCNELRDAIESKYELFNGKQTNPSLGVYLHDNSIKINDPYTYIDISTSLESYSFDSHNSMVLSNGYNNIYVDSDKSIILTVDDFEVNYTLPAGCYTQQSLFSKINSFIINQGLYFIKRGTYYALVKNNKNISISGTICDYVNFVDTTESIRVYYVDTAVLDLSSICSDYPCNITNGFNLINVFSNLCDTRKNNDNYLTSFVISKSNGINVSNAGIKNNYSNSNSTLDRYISDSNINQIDYYFERENGEPFTFNGIIVANIEIVSE